jgi:uncharacterized protein (TIGR03437 family)
VLAATLLTIQFPYNVPIGPTQLVIARGLAFSAPFDVFVDPFAPGIITPFGADFFFGYGGAINSDNPAAPGDIVYCFAVGLGATVPPSVVGIEPGIATRTVGTVEVTVGSRRADILYAGSAIGLGPGVYEIVFVVPLAAPETNQSVVLNIGGVLSNPVSLPVAEGVAAIAAVANGASFSTAAGLSPGTLVSLFATNLGTRDFLDAFPATEVDGISVLVGGQPVPLLNVVASARMLNFIVPFNLPTSVATTIQIRNKKGTSGRLPIKVSPVDVGIFLIPDPVNLSRKNAAALFANTSRLVVPPSLAAALGLPAACDLLDPSVPCGAAATAGDVLSVFFTGGGLATPGGDPNGTPLAADARPPVDGVPLYRTVITPVVTIGGVTAEVLYSGLAPGKIGLYQMNIVVPPNITPGDDVPLVVTMNTSSNMATIPIR